MLKNSKEKEENDDTDPKFLEYDLKELYELLGSFSETLFLIITHKRDHKKRINIDSSREDFIALGRMQFNDYSEKVRRDICKEQAKRGREFGDPEEAYRSIIKIISETGIPEYAGEIVGAIIVKMGFKDFCNDADL